MKIPFKRRIEVADIAFTVSGRFYFAGDGIHAVKQKNLVFREFLFALDGGDEPRGSRADDGNLHIFNFNTRIKS